MKNIVLALLSTIAVASSAPVITEGEKSLPLPGEAFQLDGYDAFVILPPGTKTDIPWVWYAPTLRGLPAKSEVWMFEQFLAKGIAIAGIAESRAGLDAGPCTPTRRSDGS